MPLSERCLAVLVAPRWALTAAHCFHDLQPSTDGINFFFGAGRPVATLASTEQVHFPPGSLSPDGTTWARKGRFAKTAPVDGLDIALVKLSSVLSPPFARLWHPAYDAALDNSALKAPRLAGAELQFAGYLGAPSAGVVRVGSEIIQGVTADSIPRLLGQNGPSHADPGDSGGGAFLRNPLRPSQPVAATCSGVTFGNPGQGPVLVGINQSIIASGGIGDFWVPVYGANLVEWIAKTTIEDSDGDSVCDLVDSCPDRPDDGRNCNQDAEDSWGASIHLGDACDPAPCPSGGLRRRQFVPAPTTRPPLPIPVPVQAIPIPIRGGVIPPALFPGGRFERYVRGRDINDLVAVQGVLAVPNPIPLDSNFTTRFCACIDPVTAAPIADSQRCRDPATFSCTLSPLQADIADEARAPVLAGQTAWHRMTIDDQQRGTSFPIHYPSSSQTRSWNYAVDVSDWLAQGFFAPPPADSSFGPGTDLGGAFWTHDPTGRGFQAHIAGGIPPICLPGVPCQASIADHFMFGVGPDTRTTQVVQALTIPIPVRGCASCARCGDPMDALGPGGPLGPTGLPRIPRCETGGPFLVAGINPSLESVIYWGVDGAGVLGNEAFSGALRHALVDPNLRWVPHSEPVQMCNADGCTKAYALAADASVVVDAWATTPEGFQLAIADEAPFSAVALRPIGKPGPSPRTGFAAAWSRLAAALYVAGGTNPATALPRTDIFRFHQGDAAWSSVALAQGHAIQNAEATIFSHLDWRLWVIDRRLVSGSQERFLMRIDPETGSVDVDLPLVSLRGYTAAWLSTLEDGRVVLAATRATSRVMALLGAEPFSYQPVVRVLGAKFETGEITSGPIVGFGQITVGVGQTTNGITVDTVQPVNRTAGELVQTFPALDADLRPNCDARPELCCPAAMPIIELSEGDDAFQNTTANRCVLARGGRDNVSSSVEGAAAVFGGLGDDTMMVGGSGPQTVYGGAGNDTLNVFGNGGSQIFGGAGDDTIYAGNGNNVLVPGPGVDNVALGTGNDTVIIYDLCEIGRGEFLDGGSGTNTLVTPVSVATLRNRGVVVRNFSNVVVRAEPCLSECRTATTCQ